jgi:hypothetical protein
VTVVGAATVEGQCSALGMSRLALDPKEDLSGEMHKQVVWVPVAEWDQDPEPALDEGTEHYGLRCVSLRDRLHDRTKSR